jgi:hypothetical protein
MIQGMLGSKRLRMLEAELEVEKDPYRSELRWAVYVSRIET